MSQDYLCLHARSQTDSKSWSIEQIRKITFSSTEVGVFLHQSDSPYMLSYDNVRKLTFEDVPIVNEIVSAETEGLSIRYDSSRRCLLINTSSPGSLQLFGTNGMLVRSMTVSVHQTEYPIGAVAQGLYVARFSNGENVKSIKLKVN